MSSEARPGETRYKIRPIVSGERAVFFDHVDLTFHEQQAEEERDAWGAALPDDRTISVWDEGELVGAAGAFRLRMTVPGGARILSAGLTMVTVKPTHRRRGILTSMMRTHLHGLHEAGLEPLSILVASEPAIYGRYGFGLGCGGIALSVPRGPNRLTVVAGSDKYRLRLVDPTLSYDACQAVYDRHAAVRPGMLARDEAFKRLALLDHEAVRGGAGPLQCVVAEAPDGTVAAYARYRVKEDYDTPGRPACKVLVRESYGTDAAAATAVWRYLLDQDLTDEVKFQSVPVDDPLFLLLHDTRSAQPTLKDHTYTRLVDVDTALAVRRYAAPVDVVFEVADEFCPWNAGRWRLTGDASGASCTRTTDSADILLGVRELGQAYLGGTTLAALGRAARLEELTPGSLAVASSAFTSDPAPWLPFGF